MKNYFLLQIRTVAFFTLLIPIMAMAQSTTTPKDYLTAPGPLAFDQKSYNLAWSSRPSANYYKQEYLLKGEVPGKHRTMLMMEVLTGSQDVKAIAGAKVEELKSMKATNPMVNYEIIQNPTTGEYILDFLVTASGPNGDISIIERNVYRYKSLGGNGGLLLFGVSTRAYAPNVDAFLTGLKANRKDLVNKVAQYKLPAIKVKP